MPTTGNITQAPNGLQATTQNATSSYSGEELNAIASDERANPGITAEQAETDVHNTETSGPTTETADQKLRDAEKRWNTQYNQMVSNMFAKQPTDTGLNAEAGAGASSHTSGSQNA